MSEFLFAICIYAAYCGAVIVAVLGGMFIWLLVRGRKEDRHPGFIDDRVLRHFVDEWSRDYYTRERQR
jgi:hypothetical protein